VNALDLAVLIAAVTALIGGWRQGIIVRVARGVGAVVGLLLVAANTEFVTERSPWSSRLGTVLWVMAALLVGWVLGRWAGELIGRAVRYRLPEALVGVPDRALGSGLAVVTVAITLWLAAPVMLLLPGWPSSLASDSTAVLRLRDAIGLAPLPIDADVISELIARGSRTRVPTELPLPVPVPVPDLAPSLPA
jgi:hypothetical protein